MFEWDASVITGNASDVFRWHPGTAVKEGVDITWQGKKYVQYPVEASGFERNASGSLPRPTLKVSNISGILGGVIRGMGGALGSRVTRKRTLGKYLDAVNFPAGNPYADPTTYFPDEIYYVSRKVSENAIWIEMELAVKFDLAGTKLPRRQVLAATCQWVYRSVECGYTGGPVQDIDGNPIPPSTQPDQCAKTLDACKARFAPNPLRTSAFPGSMLGKAQ